MDGVLASRSTRNPSEHPPLRRLAALGDTSPRLKPWGGVPPPRPASATLPA